MLNESHLCMLIDKWLAINGGNIFKNKGMTGSPLAVS